MGQKDIAKIIRGLRRQGFDVTRTTKGHWKVYDADGRLITTLPSTPSDHRSVLNSLAVLRRAGFVWPVKREG